jgi:hypothetical protein
LDTHEWDFLKKCPVLSGGFGSEYCQLCGDVIFGELPASYAYSPTLQQVTGEVADVSFDAISGNELVLCECNPPCN